MNPKEEDCRVLVYLRISYWGKKMKVPNGMDTADFVLKLGVKNSK